MTLGSSNVAAPLHCAPAFWRLRRRVRMNPCRARKPHEHQPIQPPLAAIALLRVFVVTAVPIRVGRRWGANWGPGRHPSPGAPAGPDTRSPNA